jgi:glyoxylase-like metal-dependent hydrolase (beta-lactamase superfamily II)
MKKLLAVLLLCLLVSSSAWAGGIETITLFDRQTNPDTSLLIGADAEQKAKYYPDGKLDGNILAFFVKMKGRAILFDAGLPDGRITAELKKNGIAAGDVKTILLTHLHRDHFGGLLDAKGNAAFPNADVYVGRAERAYWVDEKKDQNVIRTLAQYAGRVHVFEFGDKVLPGVKALDTSGHTPGHVSFMLKSGKDKLLVIGDLIHFTRIQLPLPEVAVRYDVNPTKAVQARKRIFDYACEKRIPVAGMHVPFPGILRLKKAGAGYNTVE